MNNEKGIVLIVFMMHFLLFGGAKIATVRNKIAECVDTIRYFFESGKERQTYYFQPSFLTLANTNDIYSLEFCPRTPREHRVMFKFDSEAFVESINAAKVSEENIFQGLEIKISISDKDRIIKEETVCNMKPYCVYGLTNSYQCVIYSFNAANLNRDYDKRMKIDMRVLRIPDRVKNLHCKAEIYIAEWVPFY